MPFLIKKKKKKKILPCKVGNFKSIFELVQDYMYFTFLTIECLIFVKDCILHASAAAKSLQSCPILCDPIDGSPPGSPIPGILQTRTLEWVAISFSNAWKWKVKSESEVTQLRPTLSDPMDWSYQAPLSMGFFQARVLEWGAIAFYIYYF